MLLANISTQAESLLNSPEQTSKDIHLFVNANKTEYMCFNREGAISTLNGGPLKLVDKFMYLCCSVSSTESDVNIRPRKTRTDIDWLSIIWKSNLPDEITLDNFQASVVSILLYGCTRSTLTKYIKKNLENNWKWILRAILNKYWKHHPKKPSCTDT